MGPSRPTAPRWADGLALAAILAVWAVGPAVRYAGVRCHSAWPDLFQDAGVTYFVVDALHGGRQLYADVAYTYGPLPVYLQAGLSWLIGNDQRAVTAFQWAFNALFGVLLYAALRRSARPGPVAAVMVLGTAALGAMPYHPIERCVMAALVLLWEPPAARSAGRAAAVGGLLGLWQWVKFGGAIYGGAALVIVDGIALAATRAGFRRWAATTPAAVAAFLLAEGALAGWAFATLPGPIAWDLIWPAHMANHYAALPDRYPTWQGWEFFATRQAVPVVGLAGSAVALALAVRDARRGRPAAFGPFVLPAFFLVGIGTYLGHYYVYLMYYWCLSVPLPALLDRRPLLLTMLYVALMAPHAKFLALDLFRPPGVLVGPSAPPLVLPNGDRIECPAEYREAYFAILDAIRPYAGQPGAAFVLPNGTGFYFHQRLVPPTRYTWLLPCFFRPYDGPAFVGEQLPRVRVLAVTGIGFLAEDFDLRALLAPVFGPELADAIAGRVRGVTFSSPVCRIYAMGD